ncbi:MAG: winged helix-turn-helix domain-containing protein [Adlercreutzia sp.]|nr:winged helix-turn-helix domain-containing protein [Adlercreutzia sp.]
MTDCELLAIDYGDLIAFCDAHTEYYMAYIEYLFSITSSQTEEIASLSFQTGLQRVAQLLVVLTGDEDLVVPYSIEELAEMVGAHRNTVSNALSRLRKAGLLEPSTRPIVVADLESLRVVAESGASS